jgi:hypothetical protein
LIYLIKEFAVDDENNLFLGFLSIIMNNIQDQTENIINETPNENVLDEKLKGKDFDLNESEDQNKDTIKIKGNRNFSKENLNPNHSFNEKSNFSNSSKFSNFGEKMSPIVSRQNNAVTLKKPKKASSQINNILNSIIETSTLNNLSHESNAINKLKLENKGFEYLPLKICILGINKEMKNTFERFLAKKYNLKIFKTENQVNDLMIKANENANFLKKEEQQILEILYSGKQLNPFTLNVNIKVNP